MILITGATGSNGSELVRQLVCAGGEPIRAMVRDPKRAGTLGGGVEVVAGDFDKPESLPAALRGVEKAFLLTNSDHLMTNRERHFLDAAGKAGVRQIVRLSAMGAGASTPVLHMHGEADRQLQASGIPFTILRPNIFYQNMLWAADTIKKIGRFFHLAGGVTMSMIDVRDIAACAARIFTTAHHEGKIYTLTGPESISYDDIAQTLTNVLGRPIQFVRVSPDAQKAALLDLGIPAGAVGPLISLFEYFATGQAAPVYPDFEQIMGRPTRSFEDFARDHAAAFS